MFSELRFEPVTSRIWNRSVTPPGHSFRSGRRFEGNKWELPEEECVGQSNSSEIAAWLETPNNSSVQSNVKRHPYYEQHEESDERLSARAGLLFKGDALGYVLKPAESSWMLSTGQNTHRRQGRLARDMWAPRAC